jgi:hypothetical protein
MWEEQLLAAGCWLLAKSKGSNDLLLIDLRQGDRIRYDGGLIERMDFNPR